MGRGASRHPRPRIALPGAARERRDHSGSTVLNVHILGGSGFVGRRIVRRLIADGHTVNALARSDAAARTLSELGAEVVRGDVTHASSLEAFFTERPAHTLVTSVSLGIGFGPRLVRAATEHGVKRALFISTTSIYTALDAATKPIRLEAERHIMSSGLDWTIVRPTMIYGGADDRNMSRLLALLRRTRFVPLPGGGGGLVQPVHVDDLVELVLSALATPAAVKRAYEAAGPRPLTLRELVTQAARALGRNAVLVPVPRRPIIAVAGLAERLKLPMPVRAEQLERLAEDKAFDISPAREELGFDPRPFMQGIAEEAAMTA